MDLRPVNPYYRQQMPVMRTMSLLRTASVSADYYYPYTWINPVTDRTQEDVDHAKELNALGWQGMNQEQKREYLAGLKGCMNRADFERIENNIQILLDVFEIDSASHVEDIPEFPAVSYFEQMKNNLAAIRNNRDYGIRSNTPQVPELPYNTWQKYNDIEMILEDVYGIVSAQFTYYAGEEIHAGDETGLLL